MEKWVQENKSKLLKMKNYTWHFDGPLDKIFIIFVGSTDHSFTSCTSITSVASITSLPPVSPVPSCVLSPGGRLAVLLLLLLHQQAAADHPAEGTYRPAHLLRPQVFAVPKNSLEAF